MPKYLGGDIIEISVKHPTLGEFRYQAKSGEAFTIDFGGLRSEDSADMITGGGVYIGKKSYTRPFFEGPIAVDMLSGNEENSLRDMAASNELGTWTISHANGTIWKLQGEPVGDIQADTSTAQMTLKVAGGGRIETI